MLTYAPKGSSRPDRRWTCTRHEVSLRRVHLAIEECKELTVFSAEVYSKPEFSMELKEIEWNNFCHDAQLIW